MNPRFPFLFRGFACICAFLVTLPNASRAAPADANPRERTSFNGGWRFAFGHPFDAAKDFNHGTAYFSDFAKAGNCDGPADPKFDASKWRQLDLPHDWAVESPFDAFATTSPTISL